MKHIFIFILVLYTFSVQGFQSKPGNLDIELLRNQFISELLEPAVNEERVREIVAGIREDGTWAGIDYKDVSRIAFQHTRHLSHLVQMSRAYKKKGSALKGKKEVKNAIYLALNYWLANDFICENWWNNEIGTPNDLTSVLLIMDKDLTKEQVEKTSAITGRAHINAPGARQSGDRIKIAGIQAKNALFKRDAGQFDMLIRIIEKEIRFVPADQRGLQADYSFHHRDDRVNNTLSYGLGYADTFAEWADKVNGTRYQFSDSTLHLLIDYYLDGICKMMIFGKYHDPGATNRDISRQRSGPVRPQSPVTPERLSKVSSYRKNELQEIIQIRRNDAKPTLSFSTFFWQTEHYTHQRPDYFTSVRMFSSRNRNMEYPYNGEGLMNHHRGDGANYLSLTGNEYFSITPVYDWQKIPGTTVVQKTSLPGETEIQKEGQMDFVGAVTNGKYGAVGFDFISPHDPLKARKAWFFFDNEYVCLGAGIRSSSAHPVVTTLDQCKLEGEVTVKTDKETRTLTKGEHQWENADWVYHQHVGYIFPGPARVILSNQEQTGNWYSINKQVNSSRKAIQADVFKLWIDHGPRARNATYQYMIMPASSKEQVEAAAANPVIDIVVNTPQIQAVYHNGLHILQVVFYKNGEVRLSNGLVVGMDSPGMLMLKDDGTTIREISISDPSRKMGRIHIYTNCKMNLKGDHFNAVWNEAKGMSEISADMPQGLFTGQSITLSF
ncbi:MAG: polysaccharide lyase beta-sandwich domain-containing protein [Bacteroidales bacterium]|jgi:chondroitin AC lyase|nr:polysaccharide lyase beta-sandwich domain-containing protein [Bacteroidales bacterium]